MDSAMDLMERISGQLAELTGGDQGARARRHGASRFAGEGASPEVLAALAAGGTVPGAKGLELAERPGRGGHAGGGAKLSDAMTKALAEGTGSAGGFLVEREVSGEVLRMLRARSAVMKLGARVVPVRKELAITSLSSGAAANYVAENANLSVSEQTFAQATLLKPKDLGTLVPVSNRLLRDASESPDAEQVLREDLAEVLALRGDLAFLQGTGTGEEPLGIKNTSGLTAAPALGANGAVPTFDNLKDTVAALRAVNAPFLKPGWAFHPRLLSTLEKVKTTTGEYLADAGLLTFDATGGGGTLLGFPFVTTSQIPTNVTAGSSTDTSAVYFSSDWSECWIGERQEPGLIIEASREASYTPDGGSTWVSAYQARQTLLRAVTAHDIGLRRPSLFTVLSGVRP